MKKYRIITLCLQSLIVRNCKSEKDALKKAGLKPYEVVSVVEVV